MKRSTFRVVIILAAIAIVGIGIIQIYWFRQAFNAEKDQFNRDVTSALHQVANRFFELNQAAIPSSNPIKQISANYYAVMINNEIDANLLEYLLREEFEKRDVLVDFEYGIYDCTDDKMVYGNYVTFNNEESLPSGELPKWKNQPYYFGVNFPNRERALLNKMDVWIFSSAILLVVIAFFVYSMIVILRQKRLSEVQKDFINTMTHEFKTPISTIAVSADVLKDPGIVYQPERLLSYATIIDNENNRLKNQVERVLQLATMDETRIHLKKEDIALCPLVKEVVSGIVNGTEKKVNIDINCDENIAIRADRLHISNLFYNLLDNAVKYSGNEPEVSVLLGNEPNGVRIEVMDRGIGIPQNEIKKVFQKFYRVPTGNIHNTRGFGLGLSYVELIVEAHGGVLNIESEEGKGTKIIIKLPSRE